MSDDHRSGATGSTTPGNLASQRIDVTHDWEVPNVDHFGRYRVLHVLGRGGMGTVFLAEAVESGVVRQVALKVLHPWLVATDEARRRFLRERQILARLEHPNIARLQEGGESDLGEAYLAMDYVAGVPIDEYCEVNSLSVRERLRLFLKVADALAYSHQNLIVHRDINPSNILVTGDGTPKLLDFGIAKPLEPLAPEQEMLQTRTGQHPMTLAYASPEQIRNEPITIATDIYSAGVLLYRLLTGFSPYAPLGEVEPQSVDELFLGIFKDERATLSGQLERQARALCQGQGRYTAGQCGILDDIVRARNEPSIQRLWSRLRGDLDVIVDRAIAPRIKERYPSMEAFADDILRYLEGQVIEARTATFGYRAGKFLRRHAWPVTAAASTVVLSLALAVTTIIQQQRTAEALAREAQARAEMEEVAAFQQRQLAELDPALMAQDIRQALAEALRDVEDHSSRADSAGGQAGADALVSALAEASLTDVAVDLLENNVFTPALDAIARDYTDQPLLQASLLQTIATTTRQLGRYALAEAPQRQALELRTAHLGETDPRTLQSAHGLAEVLSSRGAIDEAASYFEQTLALRTQVLGPRHPQTLASQARMAKLQQTLGRYEQARSMYQRTIALMREVLGESHQETQAALHNFGNFLRDLGEYRAAETLLREALTLTERRAGAESRDTITVRLSLGSVLFSAGDLAAGAEEIQRAYLDARALLGEQHTLSATALNDLALVRRSQSRFVEAEALARRAWQSSQQASGADHWLTLRMAHGLVFALQDLRRLDEAEQLARGTVARAERALGPTHPQTLLHQGMLAHVLSDVGNHAEAARLNRSVMTAQESVLGRDHPNTVGRRHALAISLYELGRLAEAEVLLDEVLGIYEARQAPNHPMTVHARVRLAYVRRDRGDLSTARTLLEDSLEHLQEGAGGDQRQMIRVLHALAEVSRRLGDLARAERLGSEAVDSVHEVFADDPGFISEVLSAHAETLAALGRMAEAKTLRAQASAPSKP